MPKGPFDATQFIATEWNSAADKAAFGNTYLHFIESGWKRSLFTKGFYQRLSNCFSHIAHYDIHGFYQTWFTCDKDRLEFLRWASRHPCYGDRSSRSPTLSGRSNNRSAAGTMLRSMS
jgi:hypothetical protein